jgi:N-acetylglutamate synthase-like GNAT family acetyltransferase
MSNARSDAVQTTFTMRPARPDDAELLTDLALRSKAYWGYDADFMAKCVPLLQITPERITDAKTQCMVLERDDATLVGFSLLLMPSDASSDPVLDDLFIDPTTIGKGAGRILLEQVLQTVKAAGYPQLFVEADPNAEAFYLKFGAERVGERESGIAPGRMLPWLRFTLA